MKNKISLGLRCIEKGFKECPPHQKQANPELNKSKSVTDRQTDRAAKSLPI
jgi:hypothetical protein